MTSRWIEMNRVVKKEKDYEVELKEDGEDDLHQDDKHERKDNKKSPTVVKMEEEDDEAGHDDSPVACTSLYLNFEYLH
jgi:uncharacterized membrane protein YkoI